MNLQYTFFFSPHSLQSFKLITWYPTIPFHTHTPPTAFKKQKQNSITQFLSMIRTHHIITTSILLIDSPNTLQKSNAGRAHARAHTYSFLLFPLWAAMGLRGSTCPDHQNLREAISRTNPPKTRLTVLVCACVPACKSYCFFFICLFFQTRRQARRTRSGRRVYRRV